MVSPCCLYAEVRHVLWYHYVVCLSRKVIYESKVKKRNDYRYQFLTGVTGDFSQINPTRVTVLFNMFIYFCSLHVSGRPCAHHQEKLLYLCDTGTCHSLCVAPGLLVGFNPTSRLDVTHTE